MSIVLVILQIGYALIESFFGAPTSVINNNINGNGIVVMITVEANGKE